MAISDAATGLLTAAALVYASSSLLLNHLLEKGEDVLPESLFHEHQKIAYLSVGISFASIAVSIALLASSAVSGFDVGPTFSITDRQVVLAGSIFLVIAVSFPSYAAMWLSLDIYGEYSEFWWPR